MLCSGKWKAFLCASHVLTVNLIDIQSDTNNLSKSKAMTRYNTHLVCIFLDLSHRSGIPLYDYPCGVWMFLQLVSYQIYCHFLKEINNLLLKEIFETTGVSDFSYYINKAPTGHGPGHGQQIKLWHEIITNLRGHLSFLHQGADYSPFSRSRALVENLTAQQVPHRQMYPALVALHQHPTLCGFPAARAT